MKKRRHLRNDGEVVFASVLERVGCLVVLLIISFIWIIGLIAVIRKIF